MARVLFTSLPLTGHLNPTLALAQTLGDQGHEVAWAVHEKTLRDRLPSGARIYPIDSDYQPPVLGEKVRGLESVRLFFEDYLLPLTEHALAPLEAAVRDFRPDVMAVDHQSHRSKPASPKARFMLIITASHVSRVVASMNRSAR